MIIVLCAVSPPIIAVPIPVIIGTIEGSVWGYTDWGVEPP